MCSASARVNVFSATTLSIMRSCASYTTPMPPVPKRRSKVKRSVPTNSRAGLTTWGPLTQENIDRCAIVPYMICAIKFEFETRRKMDWRVLFTTFGIIFLAEMGDKTQLAAMTMAAEKKRPWEVFLGASIALAAVSAVGIIVGTALGQYLPVEWIKRVAGAAFVVIGVLILIGKF